MRVCAGVEPTMEEVLLHVAHLMPCRVAAAMEELLVLVDLLELGTNKLLT